MGDLQRVLQAMAKDEANADADAMKKAMKGAGTDEKELMHILAERSLVEIERMKAAYKRRNPEATDLAKWVADETSGQFRDILLALRTLPGHKRDWGRGELAPCYRLG
jgi:annexin A7/11